MMCKSPEDFKNNAQKITFTLKNELQLRTHITEEDILDPSAREMVLFCTQLFLYLPYYLPCETIEFTCTLTDVCTKKIELRNDNNVRINYTVGLEGSSDFTINDKKFISIEPGKTEEFPVSFVSRISKPVEAVLMFNNSGDGPKQAAPMVFKLISNVTKRVSVEVISQGTDCNLMSKKKYQLKSQIILPRMQDILSKLNMKNVKRELQPRKRRKVIRNQKMPVMILAIISQNPSIANQTY